MKNQLIKDKFRASALHLIGSVVVMLFALYIVFFVWYETPFFKLYNVVEIVFLLVLIDVILGPLFTFIVYKKGKTTLKMDLLIILIVQVLAFSFGMKSIASARPAWLVLHEQVMYAVPPSLVVNDKGEKLSPSLWRQNWWKPKLVMIDDNVEKLPNSETIVYQYSDFKETTPEVLSIKKIPLLTIKNYNVDFYQHIVTNYPNAIGYLPVVTEASRNVPAALIDDSGDIIEIVFDNYFASESNTN